MKKTYLMSMLVLGIAVAAVGLGTYAQFTKSTTMDNNVVAMGTLSSGAGLYDIDCVPLSGNHIMVTDLTPSTSDWTTAGYLVWWNDPLSPDSIESRAIYDDIKDGGFDSYTTCPDKAKIKMKVTLNPTDGFDYDTCLPSSSYGIAYPWNTVVTPGGFSIYDLLWTYNPGPTGYALPGGAYGNVLNKGWGAVEKIEFKLDPDADDTFQGCGIRFDLTVTQANTL
jgi:hypothetical protein